MFYIILNGLLYTEVITQQKFDESNRCQPSRYHWGHLKFQFTFQY